MTATPADLDAVRAARHFLLVLEDGGPLRYMNDSTLMPTALAHIGGLLAERDRLAARAEKLEAEAVQAVKHITHITRSRDQYREGWLLRGRQINEGRCCGRAEKLAAARAEAETLRASTAIGVATTLARRFTQLADSERHSRPSDAQVLDYAATVCADHATATAENGTST